MVREQAQLAPKRTPVLPEAADAMARVSEIFPFSHGDKGPITAAARIEQAAALLAEARDAEAQAMAFLTAIIKIQARRPTAEPP